MTLPPRPDGNSSKPAPLQVNKSVPASGSPAVSKPVVSQSAAPVVPAKSAPVAGAPVGAVKSPVVPAGVGAAQRVPAGVRPPVGAAAPVANGARRAASPASAPAGPVGNGVRSVATPGPVGSPVKPLARPFSAKKKTTFHGSSDFLFKMLDDAGRNRVSDVHVHPNRGIWRLTSGRLEKSTDENSMITEEEILTWMTHSEGYEERGIDDPEKLFGDAGHTTVAFATGTWRVRGSFRRSTVGVSCTFRLIPSKIPTIKDVYLPEVMIDMIRRRSGLILIEGPTGSGKTTSIAALIDYINKNTDQHIYSIEDPIEYYHEPQGNTVFTMREVGIHASDYPSAVENALRSKPNIIFVGEMLSNTTKKAALHAATTGHLVITTAHAGSVSEALDSFIGEFPADEQPQIRARLATSLLGVMCQTLVPRKDGELVAAREIMLSNMNFSEIISNGDMKMIPGQMESSRDCQSLEDDLLGLLKDDIISVDTALGNAKRPEVLRSELERLGILSGGGGSAY